MKKIILFGALALFVFSSCKKEESKTNPIVVATDTRDQLVGSYSVTLEETYLYENVSTKDNETNKNSGTITIIKSASNSASLVATIKLGSDELTINISSVTNVGGNLYLNIPNQSSGGNLFTSSKIYINGSDKYDGLYTSSNKTLGFKLNSEIQEVIDGSNTNVPVEFNFIATKD